MKRKYKNFKEFAIDMLYISIGVFLVALAFAFFLDPYDIVAGGVSGLAIVLKPIIPQTSISILVINSILLIIAFFLLGKGFFLKTIYGSIAFPVFAWVLNIVYEALKKSSGKEVLIPKDNMLLVVLFGAIIMGIGLGMILKRDSSTGGGEIPQTILYKYLKIPFSVSLYIIDGTIVTLGFLFVRDSSGALRYEFLLYAILFIAISGFVLDQIVFSGYNSRSVAIISEKNDQIKAKILEFNRGVTEVDVRGGYTGAKKTKLICVLSSRQFSKLKRVINDIDPHAFYYVVRAHEVGGEGFSYEK